jgi:hypothetical protein
VTFADRLAGDRRRVSLWVTIQGIKEVFKETVDVDCSTILGETRTEIACLYDVEEGQQALDYVQRAVLGGSLSFKLRKLFGDTTLSNLFRPRRRRVAFVTEDVDKTETGIDVNSVTWAGSSGTCYIGGETIAYASVVGSTLTDCTRGMYGSFPAEHFTASETGAAWGSPVYDVPPNWVGRRVSLYCSFLDDDGTATAANTEQVGCFTIEGQPKYSEGAWCFDCAPVADEFAARQCFVGMRDVTVTDIDFNDATDLYEFTVDDGSYFTNNDPFVSTLVVGTGGDDGMAIRAFRVVSATGNVVSCVSESVIQYEPRGPLPRGPQSRPAKHICSSYGASITSILPFLTSVEGDLTNGDYDVFPGVQRGTLQGKQWAFGAGIPDAYIDDSWEEIRSGEQYTLVVDRMISVGELLRAHCWRTDTFWRTTRDGKLGISYASDTFVTAGSITETIDSDSIVPGSEVSSYDESSIFPVLDLKCNYDPAREKFMGQMNIVDHELKARYQHHKEPLQLDLLGLYVNLAGFASPGGQVFQVDSSIELEELETKARRWMTSDGRGRVLVSAQCRLKHAALQVGDIVNIDLPGLPDFEGTTGIGTTQGTAEVVSRRARWSTGVIEMTFRMRERVFCIAPFVVGSVRSTTSVANDTITINGTTDGEGSTDDFFVGQDVLCWQDGSSISQALVVAAITATTIRFTTGVTSFTANSTWFTWANVGNNAGTTTTSGVAESDLAFNVTYPDAIAAGEIRRWR